MCAWVIILRSISRPEPFVSRPDRDFIFKDLLDAVYWFDESLQRQNKAAGYPEMSRSKSLIMLSIAQGMQRPIQIAEKIGLTRQAVHFALKELQDEGLISMEDDPDDKRAKRVFFSEDDKREEMRLFSIEALARIEAVLAERVGRRNFEIFRNVLQADWGDYVTPETKP